MCANGYANGNEITHSATPMEMKLPSLGYANGYVPLFLDG